MNNHKHIKPTGFTIVEVLVVIAVISILLTIGGLTWQSVRNNALDNEQKNNALRLKEAIDKYHQDNGEYPKPTGCANIVTATDDTAECRNGQLASLLVPRYLEVLPKNRAKADFYYIVRHSKDPQNHPDGYALQILDGNGNASCKTGQQLTDSWWTSVRTCDF